MLGNAGVIAGAVIATLFGLALLAAAIVGIIVLIVVVKSRKKYKYTPPAKSKTAHNSYHMTKQAGNESPASSNGSPSVNVVRPKVGYHIAPTTSAPSAPPRHIITEKSVNSGPSYPPPPRPVPRPPPPKSVSHAPPPPSKPPLPSYRPPPAKPAPPAPHKPYPASSAAKPPPPPTQKPQGEYTDVHDSDIYLCEAWVSCPAV